MSLAFRDLRHSIRLLWKEKPFTFTVLVTLAVCVGANAAIFSVVKAVLLSPLPFADADRLVVMYNSYPGAGVPRASNGATDYFVRRERLTSFSHLAQYQGWGNTVGEPGETTRVESMRVTASYFPLLGVRPQLGRSFIEQEMEPGNEQVIVLSHAFWQEWFAGDPAVLERELRIDGRPFRIVGVLPADFRLPQNEQPRFYIPIPYALEDRGMDEWHSNNYQMLGRLRPGVTVERARQENDALNAALVAEWTVPNGAQLLADAGYHTVIVPAREDLVRDVRGTLFVLWGGAALVLLIGCVNIASLIVARGQVRLRETATRLAIGAPRRRLVRLVLTHALVLATLGGVLGVGVGVGGISALGAFGAANLPRGADIGLDATVLIFTLALAGVAGLIFGAIPSAQLLRTDLRSVLQTESRGGTTDRGTLSVRTALVTAQIALAYMLLIGAGLMLVSFRSAIAVEPGFDADHTLTAYISLPGVRYPDGGAREQFTEVFLSELRALPGVSAAAFTTQLPFTGSSSSSVIMPRGYAPPAGESILSPLQTWIDDDYFGAMRIPVIDGRPFEVADGKGDRRVIILDEWLARRYFGDESAIGKEMLWGEVPETAEEGDYYIVVGVVGTIKHNDLTAHAADHVGAYYFPYRQNPGGYLALVIRTTGDAESLAAAVRARLARLDAELPLFDVKSMRARVDDSLGSRRASMFLLLAFAGVALFLAVIGVYGAVAYNVAQRTRELGIRMALGSTTREVFLLVLRHGTRITAIGLLLGGFTAVLAGRLIRSLLFGVGPLDPGVIGSVAALVGVAALGACALPALRAARVSPIRAIAGE